ncbi:hypothetical protein GW17_00006500 [Ensete ventricosum]|nr:hypothetical protein GW17_00006500 [Ensete ventricosum]
MDKMETAVSYVERKHLTLLDRRVSTRILSLYPRAGINKIATQTQEHRKKKKRRGIESYEIGKRTEGAYQNAKANRFDLDDELSVSLRIKSPTWGRTFRYSSPFNPLESGSGRLWVRIRIPESGSDYPLPNGTRSVDPRPPHSCRQLADRYVRDTTRNGKGDISDYAKGFSFSYLYLAGFDRSKRCDLHQVRLFFDINLVVA